MAGIIDTIKLAGTLVLALPAALAGLEFLLVRGETAVGAVLIGLAIGLVLVQHRLTLPSDVPTAVAKRVVGTVRKDPDDADDR
ncbi:hypothetical protein C491_00877 [Natronococcus amylolyticus DSM 10524]|uniref:Uncharacterized protein n=1 Tax=Natronococcus amylolyticus DSM 10524 TaxID=1227497 RepID=L9XIC9_9EURY|nr:hypothetical protein [Natronococcus amylolyticus]ELY61367.1 hypothetical protein C491_00877 [Natronococcus amylolyticus DSM 10524]